MFSRKNEYFSAIGAAILLVVLTGSVISVILPQPAIYAFLDIGQGDSILIRTPDGQNVLVDSGPDKSVVYQIEKILPWYDRTIDAMILTHPDADHDSGLTEVLKRLQVNRVISTGVVHPMPAYVEWLSEVRAEGKTVEAFHQGDSIILDHGIRMEAIAPRNDLNGASVEDTNNSSLVFLVTTPSAKILLTGDAEDTEEKDILASISKETLANIDILKVGHHGSRFSTSAEFLQVLHPQYAVISAGKNNLYGHPHLDTLKRLRDIGAQILRTDQNEMIVFYDDQNGLRLQNP